MRNWWSDARHFQIVALSSLLTINFVWFDFGARPLYSALAISSALATQVVCSRYFGLPRIDLRSPLITGLSLSLLLRADEPWLPAIAGVIAIASKFVLRIDGKHIWNPAGFAIVVLLLTSNGVWISPGQWGTSVWFGSLLAFLAILVLRAAQRSDVALFFLGSHAALLLARAYWLGDPLAIPLHQTTERVAADLCLLHDLRSTNDAGFAARPLPVRVGGGVACPLSRIFHANAAGALRGVDRAVPRYPSARQNYSGETVRMDSNPPRSIAMTRTVRSRLKASVAACGNLRPARRSGGTGERILRFLCGQGRCENVQQILEGRHYAKRPTDRHHHGERLRGRAQRICARGPGADLHREKPDQRRRAQDGRSSRRLHGAAAGGILRPRSMRTRHEIVATRCPQLRQLRLAVPAPRSHTAGSKSKHNTMWPNTTFQSSRPRKVTA